MFKIVNINERVKRIPVYTAVVVYVFRYKRFPYYMEYEMFKMDKVMKQIGYSMALILLTDMVYDLSIFVYNNNYNNI
jgi:hypothetical protein